LLTLLPLMLLRPGTGTYGPDVNLLTTTQAARELGVSARSLARWAQEGRLKPALVTPGGDKRSGRYLWDLDDLRDQLLKLRTRPE
jgi:DNA-binding transcriptional MerR regulator